jgi:hypothetical protein
LALEQQVLFWHQLCLAWSALAKVLVLPVGVRVGAAQPELSFLGKLILSLVRVLEEVLPAAVPEVPAALLLQVD